MYWIRETGFLIYKVMLILAFRIWIADCNALVINAKRFSWSLNPKSEIQNPQSESGFAGFGPLTPCLFPLRSLGCQKRFDIFYKINPDLIFRVAELVGDEGYN